jgi:hypothetical protein
MPGRESPVVGAAIGACGGGSSDAIGCGAPPRSHHPMTMPTAKATASHGAIRPRGSRRRGVT